MDVHKTEARNSQPNPDSKLASVKLNAGGGGGGDKDEAKIDLDAIKLLENIYIKIGDAKKLIAGNKDGHNCYCSVRLDREEVCKTHVVEKTSSPFFQQEFNFDIPHNFQNLCFYLHDTHNDVSSKRDNVFAKVVVRKTDLEQYNGREHWFPLSPVDHKSEVQGQMFVEIKFQQYLALNQNGSEDGYKLIVRIPQCDSLHTSGGNCDPYISMTLQGVNKSETKKSRVKKSSINPHFDEEFTFELNKNSNLRRSWFELPIGNNDAKLSDQEHWSAQVLRIAVLNSGTLGDDFMGEVRIPLSNIKRDVAHSGWYMLNPRSDKATSTSDAKEEFGSLRIKITYTKDTVFPSSVYEDFLQHILNTDERKVASASWPALIGAISGTRRHLKAAQSLVRLFLQQGKLLDLILPLADDEISNTKNPHLIFRNSSFSACLIEESLRLIGMSYLQNVLAQPLERIEHENKPCEIDPSRLSYGDMCNSTGKSLDASSNAAEQLQNNMLNLWEYVSIVVRAIVMSPSQCPSLLCEVFNGLRNSASSHFTDDVNVRYRVVTNFLFLRFFSAALLCPKKYKLIAAEPHSSSGRTFALLSNVVQRMCNLSLPKPTQSTTTAAFIKAFFDKFVKPEDLERIRSFVDIISSAVDFSNTGGQTSTVVEKVTLKEGEMVKRAQGRTFLVGRKNFKTRYFSLTNYELSYGKHKKSKPLCTIPVQQIKGIEKLQEDSFRMAYMFQVIQPNRVLYCKANNSVEQKEWMDVLTRVCNCNRNRAQHYHPGAFVQGKYSWLPASIRVNIDQDRDLERLYVMLSASVGRIRELQEECGAKAVYIGPVVHGNTPAGSDGEGLDGEELSIPRTSHHSSFNIKDPRETFRSLCSILECVEHLDEVHEAYNKAMKLQNCKPGTKEKPYEGT